MTEFQYLDGGTTEAQNRLATSFLFKQDSVGLASDGVLTGLGVTQTGTASSAVLVAAGAGVVQDSVANGAAVMVNDTQKTLDVLTANPVGGLPRNDVIVFDSATSSIRAIIGTPNASPTDPTVPTTAFPLARIRNLASATTIPTAQIDDRRVSTWLAGSIPSVASLTALNALPTFVGARAIRTDENGRLYYYDGTAWVGQVRSESGFVNHNYGGGVGPVTASVTFSRPFTNPPAMAITSTTYQIQTYYGGLSTTGVSIASRGDAGAIPASGTYQLSWTATGW